MCIIKVKCCELTVAPVSPCSWRQVHSRLQLGLNTSKQSAHNITTNRPKGGRKTCLSLMKMLVNRLNSNLWLIMFQTGRQTVAHFVRPLAKTLKYSFNYHISQQTAAKHHMCATRTSCFVFVFG